jgi:hypothetical protein
MGAAENLNMLLGVCKEKLKNSPTTLYHLSQQELWVSFRAGSSMLHFSGIGMTAIRVRLLFQQNFRSILLNNGQ